MLLDFNIPKECMRHIYVSMDQCYSSTFWNKKLCTTKMFNSGKQNSTTHANQDSRIVTTKCYRQVRKKGSSPDPAAPVLPGVCQARHGMIPPPGTPTHLSRTAVPLTNQLVFLIPQSSICCICQKRKGIPQSNTEPSLSKFEQSMDQLFNHDEKSVRFATFLTQKIEWAKK
jgi:hypothetical protein